MKLSTHGSSQKGSGQSLLWQKRIEQSEAASVWQSLQRMVSSHPLVRSALGNPQTTNAEPPFSIHDLTQDLYVLLLQKGRFNHYLASGMSDAEIEREIFQIELTNLLIGNLRRRRPENYRIVRRVSQILENDQSFRRYARNRKQYQVERYRQAAEAVFGLKGWNDDKRIKDSGTFDDLIASVPTRCRNRRRSGCTGETQVIVSNQELVELMVEIFKAIDSPAPLRVLRQLALSKLPVFDPTLTSIDDETNDERRNHRHNYSLVSSGGTPEEHALNHEQETEVRLEALEFLNRLSHLTRSNPMRTERFWRILWHCYFDSNEPSQLEIAELLGMSDSSVSDYRRRIEGEMRNLRFSPEHLSIFAEELKEQLQRRLSTTERIERRQEFGGVISWPGFRYSPPVIYSVASAA
ncbi:MAG: sigma-70 family RNA polymerase sigma factor [Acidobacteria bacterium]|nr:sigma-70 family RNA polymerase sigma factor [Acidobacteriota bacterium]